MIEPITATEILRREKELMPKIQSAIGEKLEALRVEVEGLLLEAVEEFFEDLKEEGHKKDK